MIGLEFAAVNMVAREITADWKMLARFLGLEHCVIEEIDRYGYAKYKEKAHQALRKWQRKSGENATKQVLIAALEDVSRKDIADDLRNMWRRNSGKSPIRYLQSNQISTYKTNHALLVSNTVIAMTISQVPHPLFRYVPECRMATMSCENLKYMLSHPNDLKGGAYNPEDPMNLPPLAKCLRCLVIWYVMQMTYCIDQVIHMRCHQGLSHPDGLGWHCMAPGWDIALNLQNITNFDLFRRWLGTMWYLILMNHIKFSKLTGWNTRPRVNQIIRMRQQIAEIFTTPGDPSFFRRHVYYLNNMMHTG